MLFFPTGDRRCLRQFWFFNMITAKTTNGKKICSKWYRVTQVEYLYITHPGRYSTCPPLPLRLLERFDCKKNAVMFLLAWYPGAAAMASLSAFMATYSRTRHQCRLVKRSAATADSGYTWNKMHEQEDEHKKGEEKQNIWTPWYLRVASRTGGPSCMRPLYVLLLPVLFQMSFRT